MDQTFLEKLNEFLLWNFYSVYAILIVMNQFDFFLFKKDHISDLFEIFEKSSQVSFLGQERSYLLRDKDLLTVFMPNEFKCGIFSVNISEIKG